MMNQKSFKWTTLLVFFIIAYLAFGSNDGESCTLCRKTLRDFNTMVLTKVCQQGCMACFKCAGEMKKGMLKYDEKGQVVVKDRFPERGEKRKCACDTQQDLIIAPMWFQNFDPDRRDLMKPFLTDAVDRYGSFNDEVKTDLFTEFKITGPQAEALYEFVYRSNPPVNNTQILNDLQEVDPVLANLENQLTQFTEKINENPLLKPLKAVATVHKCAVSPRYQFLFPAMEYALCNFQADKSMILPQPVSNFLIIYGGHQITKTLLVSGIKSFVNSVLTDSTSQYVPYINGFLDAFLEGFIDYGTFVAMIFTLSGTVEITTIISIVGFLMLFKMLFFDIKF